MGLQVIPKKIHHIFFSSKDQMPEVFQKCMEITEVLHPEWEINLYDESKAQNFITTYYPNYKDIYNEFTLGVQRSDLLRVMLMYVFGGFYLDLDIYLLKKLDPLLKKEVVLGIEKTVSRETCRALQLKYEERIANYMFASIPGHPFWAGLLDLMLQKSKIRITSEDDVLETTGPGVLTNFYHENKKSFKNISLLTNKTRRCLIKGHDIIGCHFGSFGAHLHQGTWRWEKK